MYMIIGVDNCQVNLNSIIVKDEVDDYVTEYRTYIYGID